VLLVAGVDALRAVTDVEVPVERELGDSPQDRDADLLRGTGIDQGLVDDDITRLQQHTHGIAGRFQEVQVRLFMRIYGGGDSDNEQITIGQIIGLFGVGQFLGGP